MVSKWADQFAQITAAYVGVMFAYTIFSVVTILFSGWYTNLLKPPIILPLNLFVPIWLIVYLFMSGSLYLIWRRESDIDGFRNILFYLIAIIILPIVWSAIYYGLHLQIVGLILLIIIWILTVLTIKKLWNITNRSGIMLIPSLVWVGYLIILNSWILILNY